MHWCVTDLDQVDHLCEVLASNNAKGKSSDLFFGLRCFTMDTITSFCSAKSVDALGESDFKAPAIEAMEANLSTFIIFKHFSSFVRWYLQFPLGYVRRFVPKWEA